MLCLGKPHHRWDALSMQGNEHFSAASWYSPLFRTKISNFCSYTLLKFCWSWKFGTCNVAVGDCSAGKGICAHMLTEILMQCMAPVYPWGCRPQWACCILVLSANELPSIASSLPLTHLASLSPLFAPARFLSAVLTPQFLSRLCLSATCQWFPDVTKCAWSRAAHVQTAKWTWPAVWSPQPPQNVIPGSLFFQMPPNALEPN